MSQGRRKKKKKHHASSAPQQTVRQTAEDAHATSPAAENLSADGSACGTKKAFGTQKQLLIGGGIGLLIVCCVLLCTFLSGGILGQNVQASEEGLLAPETKEGQEADTQQEPQEILLSERETQEPAAEEAEEEETQEEGVYDLTDVIDILDVDFPFYVKVNRLANCVTVYTLGENGSYDVPVKAMICSTGENTPLGVFTTSDRYSWRYLEGDVYGQYAYRITGHILFHSVPYYKQDKSTLEAEEYNQLGESVSLGCVRLACIDAKWIYDNCPVGTTVEIYDDADPGPLGRPSSIFIDADSPYAGWDPTDPDPDNPWNALDGAQEEETETSSLEAADEPDREPAAEDAQKTATEAVSSKEDASSGSQQGRREGSAWLGSVAVKEETVTLSIGQEDEIEEILLSNLLYDESWNMSVSFSYGKLKEALEGHYFGTYPVYLYVRDEDCGAVKTIYMQVCYTYYAG